MDRGSCGSRALSPPTIFSKHRLVWHWAPHVSVMIFSLERLTTYHEICGLCTQEQGEEICYSFPSGSPLRPKGPPKVIHEPWNLPVSKSFSLLPLSEPLRWSKLPMRLLSSVLYSSIFDLRQWANSAWHVTPSDFFIRWRRWATEQK